MAPARGKELLRVRPAIILTAGAFRRREAKIGVAHQFIEQGGNAASRERQTRIFIESPAAPREMRDERVDEHVARAGVKGENLSRLRRRRDDGDVADAAKIQGDAPQLGVAKKKIVHVRDKRRALTAQGDVGRAKVTDGGDARSGSDDGRLADLKGRGGGVAEKGDGAALMEDRLAVAADQRDARWRHPKTAGGAEGGFREDLTEAKVELAELAGCCGIALRHAQNLRANASGKGKAHVIQQLCIEMRGLTGDSREGHVDAVR